MRPDDPGRLLVQPHGGQELGGSDAARLGPELRGEQGPLCGPLRDQVEEQRAQVLAYLLALADQFERQFVGRQQLRCPGHHLVRVRGGEVELPGAGGHCVLQRGRPGLQLPGRRGGDPDRQAGVQTIGQVVDPAHTRTVLVQVHVEVLGQALVAGGERQTEVQPGVGREPLAVGHREVGPAHGPLDDPGQVAVRQEPDLAELAVPDPGPHHTTPAWGRLDRVTGTAPPTERSWPVPWLPPAGGVAEATMCSMP